jgi:Calx-beta domain
VQFAATNTVVKEKAGTFAVIEVTRSGGADIASSVVFDTFDKTATAGLDYTALTAQIVTFAPGETIKRVLVPILGDKLAEFDETIGLRLSKAAGDFSTNVLGDTIDALLTIKGKPLVL